MTGLRVIVCDDHRTMRDAFAAYLTAQPAIDTVTTAADADEAIRAAGRGADVLVLDLRLAGEETALDVVEALRNRAVALPVLVIGDVRDLDLTARVLALGALGYLPKTAAPPDLYDAVCQVAAGHAYIPDDIVDPLLRRLRAELRIEDDARALFARLTDRERQVLQLLVQGVPRHDIARRLELSSNTVRTHLRHLMQTMGVSTQLAAAARGREMYEALHPNWNTGDSPAVIDLARATAERRVTATDRGRSLPH